MTSRERVLSAFAHREPDRVPAWCGASPEFRELARNALNLSDDESLSLYLGDDFRRVHARYAGPDDRSPGAGLTHSGATSRTPFGIERQAVKEFPQRQKAASFNLDEVLRKMQSSGSK